MKPPFLIIAVLSLSFLMTCQPETKKKDVATEAETALKVEEDDIFVSWKGCVEPDSSCTYFKVNYLKIVSPEPKTSEVMNHQIQKTLLNLLKGFGSGTGSETSLEEIGKAFVDDYDAFIHEFPESVQVWSVETLMDKTYETGEITTFRIDVESYTGGAHGNYITKFLNFKSKSGELVGLEDVFPDTIQLKQALLVALRNQKSLEDGDDLGEAGFFLEDGKIPLSDNFGFTETGFIFHFDPYIIAPFAMGAIEIEIPRSAVKTKSFQPV
jgi:hypothetical protein